MLALTSRKMSWAFIASIYLLALPQLLIDLYGRAYAGVKMHYWGYYPVAGELYYIFPIMYFTIFIVSAVLLYINYIKEVANKNRQKTQQYKYVLFAYAIGTTGVIDYLIKFGLNVYPYGYISALLYIALVAYAVLKHRLMDINIVLKKTLVYTTMAGLLTGAYLLVVYMVSQSFTSIFGPSSIYIMVTLIIFFAFAFQPLKDKIQEFIDKRFYKSKYSYQNMLRHLSQYAVSVIELDKLLKLISEKVRDSMKLEGAAILIEEKKLAGNAAMVKLLLKERAALDQEELAHRAITKNEPELAQAQEEMRRLGAALSIPLFFEEKLIGLFNLGNKLSQDMFTDEDIDLLTTLANQLAIAIENARLHEANLAAQKQLLQADKLSALGRIAAGMAHEIKNPLAALKGMTQAIDKNVNDPEFLEDFKRVVPKEIDRLDGLVDSMIQLGKPPRLIFAPVKLNDLIEHNLKLFEHRCRNHQITIIKELGALPEIEADPQQLTQVITNLILNAIQAMPQGGRLTVNTRATAGAVVLEIADTGRGIPADKVKDIFEPFFTTREEGLGLGLAITYQIIKGHNGEITVESKVGEGTRFRITLPR